MDSLQMESIKTIIESLPSEQKTEIIKHVYLHHNILIERPVNMILKDVLKESDMSCDYNDKGKYKITIGRESFIRIEINTARYGKTIYKEVYENVIVIGDINIKYYFNINISSRPYNIASIDIGNVYTLKQLVDFIQFLSKYKSILLLSVFKFIISRKPNFNKEKSSPNLYIDNYKKLLEYS